MRTHWLSIFTIFFAGMLTMILEMAGGRLLAPIVGTSVPVWTCLIAVFLLSMSAGACYGGRLADQDGGGKVVGKLFLMAAMASLPAAYFVWLPIALLPWPLLALALFCSLFFAAPAFFLGAVSPCLVKAELRGKADGTMIGLLSAAGTLGSILGTVLGGMVLIQFLPSWGIILLVIISLLSLAVLHRKLSPVFLLGTFILFFLPVHKNIVETPYGTVLFYEGQQNNRPAVFMSTGGLSFSHSTIYTDKPDEIASRYLQFQRDVGLALHPTTRRALLLGGGALSLPRGMNIPFDVVEIDAKMTEEVEKRFGIPANVTIIHEDARIFMAKNNKKYDLVFVDVFNSGYSIPFHLTTKEAIEQMKRQMTENGILFINTLKLEDGKNEEIRGSLYSALKKQFSFVTAKDINPKQKNGNIILMGSDKPFSVKYDTEKITEYPVYSDMNSPFF